MNQTSIELVRILSDDAEVNYLQHEEMVDENASSDSDDEHQQLRKDESKILHVKNLSGDDRRNAKWTQPETGENDHFHNDFKNCREKVHHHTPLLANRAENHAKGETEEDDAERVGAAAILQHTNNFLLNFCVRLVVCQQQWMSFWSVTCVC